MDVALKPSETWSPWPVRGRDSGSCLLFAPEWQFAEYVSHAGNGLCALETEIEVDRLHQLSFRADRVERLQQQGAQQFLRCDRRPTDRRVRRIELPRHPGQNISGYPAYHPQRVVLGNPIFEINIRKQSAIPYIRTAHRFSPLSITENHENPASTSLFS